MSGKVSLIFVDLKNEHFSGKLFLTKSHHLRVLAVLLLCVVSANGAGAILATPTSKSANNRVQSRFETTVEGFTHCGFNTIPAGDQWIKWNGNIPAEEYARLANDFHPTHFRPGSRDEPALFARMNYPVLTSLHHVGFALFADGTNASTAANLEAHRDFVAGYFENVRETGLRAGFYHKPPDWGLHTDGMTRTSFVILGITAERQNITPETGGNEQALNPKSEFQKPNLRQSTGRKSFEKTTLWVWFRFFRRVSAPASCRILPHLDAFDFAFRVKRES